ncbi:hypothetical protein BC826DRAFT_994792, partial [Russula brevipes]
MNLKSLLGDPACAAALARYIKATLRFDTRATLAPPRRFVATPPQATPRNTASPPVNTLPTRSP